MKPKKPKHRDIKGKELIPVLEKLGFEKVRDEGKFKVYLGTDLPTVGVAMDEVVPPRLINCLLGEIGISREEFWRLLKAS